ncbi:MAG TPA: hypothetical protein DCG28_02460 [Lachnospiraceae bacterium]|nr:hypothetical protein [Lachnospiraceae bacterium]
MKNKKDKLTVKNIGTLLAFQGTHILAVSETKSEGGMPVYGIFLGDPENKENNQYMTLTAGEITELKKILNSKESWTE